MTSPPTGLFHATSIGDIDTVRSLIDAGADINAPDASGAGTLLSFHPPMVDYLLSKGANPDAQYNENGASVLAGLAYRNQLDCVRLLLKHGANADRGRVESLETPLHHALAGDAADNCTELVQLLIDHGANVNAKTQPGVISYNFWREARTRSETPLHRAAAFASIETIKALLHAGAKRMPDINGDSPLAWASWHRRTKNIIDLLRNHSLGDSLA